MRLKNSEKGKVPFFPDHFLSEYAVMLLVILVLIILSFFIRAPLEEKADPTTTPLGARSPWYFLFLYQLLKYVPKVVGVFWIPLISIVLLLALPFLDRNPSRRMKDRPIMVILGVIAVIAILILTYLGSRPYELGGQ